jgi:hypothetical protein
MLYASSLTNVGLGISSAMASSQRWNVKMGIKEEATTVVSIHGSATVTFTTTIIFTEVGKID